MKTSVLIQTESFDVTHETMQLRGTDYSIGAVVTFLGLVRDLNDGKSVGELYLECYPDMAEKEIKRILAQAGTRWPLLAARVVHRVGALRPSDLIVYVGVASEHRGDAFQACEFIMDHLKTQVPFWKKESTQRLPGSDSGVSAWLESKASDVLKQKGWE